ncbi:MAG: hypothetical protein LBO09_00830 [Candidatus Peribacteria bacterium]|nr:hypothetical protein [Candidatus Peribacteria bacterium]
MAGQTPKLEITTYTEQKESILDKPISPESLKDTVDEKVLEYFRDFGASDVIIDFRTKKDIFNKFYKYIEAGKTDDGKNTNYEQAAKLFQDYLKTTNLKDNADLVNAFDISADKLVGNLNFIYSSLSRVRKTQHKQFGSVDRTQPNWQDKQREYMVQAKQKLWTEAQKIIEKTSLSATNKNTLKPLVEARIVNDEKNFAEIEKILGHFPAIATPTTPEKQLYCMLADYKYIASSRDSAFASLIVNEKDGVTDNKGNPYFKKGSNSYDELMKARDAVKKTLDFPFDNASERNGVGLVFAYGNGESLDGHHEKFVNSPLYVGNANTNLADITETRTKEYFLRHLEKFQKNENVLTNTIQKIKMYVNDEKKL